MLPFASAGHLTYRTQCSLPRSCEEARLQDRQEWRVRSQAHVSMCLPRSPLIGRTQPQGAMRHVSHRQGSFAVSVWPSQRQERVDRIHHFPPHLRCSLDFKCLSLYKLFPNLESCPLPLPGSSSKSYFTSFLKILVTFPDKSALLSFGFLCQVLLTFKEMTTNELIVYSHIYLFLMKNFGPVKLTSNNRPS